MPRGVSHIPSPEEAKARLGRVIKFLNLVFEVNLGDGAWRLVRIGDRLPMPNEVRPELSMLAFKLLPLVITPYLSEIGGTFFATRQGFERGVISWAPTTEMGHLSQLRQPQGRSLKVGFRAANEDAAAWFILRLAKVGGAQYRSHKLLRQDQYEYTREP